VSPRRILPVARQSLRLLLGNPAPLFLFFFTPMLMMAILRPTFQRVLQVEGFHDVNGSEQVVPGFIAFFGFFWCVFIGRTFFDEHSWGTWQRLQTSEASPVEILVGKVAPAFVLILGQIVLLFVIGALVFDLHSAASVLPLLLIALPLAAVVTSLTILLVGVLKEMIQLDAVGNLMVMVFAALGGGLAPVPELPKWAQDIAPVVPSYWATKAARRVILQGESLSGVVVPALALCGYALVFTVVAFRTFDFSDQKVVA
jgi:ABC-2 type transport system permease protein